MSSCEEDTGKHGQMFPKICSQQEFTIVSCVPIV